MATCLQAARKNELSAMRLLHVNGITPSSSSSTTTTTTTTEGGGGGGPLPNGNASVKSEGSDGGQSPADEVGLLLLLLRNVDGVVPSPPSPLTANTTTTTTTTTVLEYNDD